MWRSRKVARKKRKNLEAKKVRIKIYNLRIEFLAVFCT